MSIPVAPAADRQWWMQMLAVRPASTAASAAGEAKASLAAVEEATPTQLEAAVKEVNASLESRSVGLHFEVDKDLDRVIVKVVDRESGEVIRQIPTEEVVRIAKVLQGKVPGLLMSHDA